MAEPDKGHYDRFPVWMGDICLGYLVRRSNGGVSVVTPYLGDFANVEAATAALRIHHSVNRGER